MNAEHVLVMAKAPVPGRVKTRLCPPCTPDEAAAIAEAALIDTLGAVAACGARRKVIALDGAPGPWLPPGVKVIPQRGRGLAERLAFAWADTGGAGLQIGMDTPHVGSHDLDRLLALVTNRQAVLGPANDGGWWAIGLPPVDARAVFCGIPMSAPRTGLDQLSRLRRLGLKVAIVERRRDIDTFADLLAVATNHPATRTAAVAQELGLIGAVGRRA